MLKYETIEAALADRELIFADSPWRDNCDGQDYCASHRKAHIEFTGECVFMVEVCTKYQLYNSLIVFKTLDLQEIASLRSENLYHRNACNGGRTWRRAPDEPPNPPDQDLRRNPVPNNQFDAEWFEAGF
jgi:hypothetical protein